MGGPRFISGAACFWQGFFSARAEIMDEPLRCRTAVVTIPTIPIQLRCDIETIRTRRRLTSPVDCDFPVEAGTTENTSAEEMIMSVTLTALVAPEARAARSRTCGLDVSRWWAACINWRIEHASIPQLCAMSDRKLKDIGPHPLSHSAKCKRRSGLRGKIAGAAAERAGKHIVMKSNMMSPVQ